MNNMSKKELTKVTKARYKLADKKTRGIILNEFCNNTGYHRKYAIGLLNGKREKVKERVGRRRKYSSQLFANYIIPIWELLDFPCGTRLQPELINMARAMDRFNGIKLTTEVSKQLIEISGKTLDRRLKKEKENRRLNRNRGTTRHGSLLKSSIPIKLTSWNLQDIGLVEVDTVAHNGGDPSGEFIYSLNLVEICSGWSEQYATMGKGERGVIKGIDDIKKELPFNLIGIDSDNGSEFVNWHLVRYCRKMRYLLLVLVLI